MKIGVEPYHRSALNEYIKSGRFYDNLMHWPFQWISLLQWLYLRYNIVTKSVLPWTFSLFLLYKRPNTKYFNMKLVWKSYKFYLEVSDIFITEFFFFLYLFVNLILSSRIHTNKIPEKLQSRSGGFMASEY